MGALALALVGGRRAPLAGALVAFGVLALLPVLSRTYYDELFLPFASPFVAAYWLGAYGSPRAVTLALAPCTALCLAATLPYDDDATLTGGLFTVAISLVAPIVVGRLLRSRAALNRALREKAALLERHREDAAGRAVLDERTRIAGELHDVVAHALSAMTVQATGARRLALTRPELARAAFGAIESAGREALDELRRLLGVLRLQDAERSLAPQPSLRHVQSLVRRTAAAGLPVRLKVEGDERELPAGIDVTAYRVIQDALAAALEVGGAGPGGGAPALSRRHAGDHRPRRRPPPPPAAADRHPRTGHPPRRPLLLRRPPHHLGPRRPRDPPARRRHLPQGEEPAEPPCELSQRRDRALRRLRTATTGRLTASWPTHRAARRRRAAARRSATARARRHRASPLLARLLRHFSRADLVDGAAAAMVAVVGVVEVVLAPHREGSLLANVVLALGYTLPLAWRRRAPIPAVAVTIASVLAMSVALTPVNHLFAPFLVALSLVYAAAAYRDGLEAYTALVLIVAAMPVIVSTFDVHTGGDYLFPPLIGVLAWLAGRVVRSRTRLSAELHETAARLAEANEDAQREAAAEERRRIAREMHDLVAHSMSVMVVQAGGARRILDRDPARALEAATRIERAGREALGEMRHLLGVLNGTDQPPALTPQPKLAEIGELVSHARAAGLPTVLEFRGERRELPAGLDLAAYRIVQEALTNALKHAGRAPTTVIVDWSDEQALTLEVRDHGGSAPHTQGAGHGLVGMRERVKLYGGELDTGPADGGGWRVRATFPMTVRELSPA